MLEYLPGTAKVHSIKFAQLFDSNASLQNSEIMRHLTNKKNLQNKQNQSSPFYEFS